MQAKVLIRTIIGTIGIFSTFLAFSEDAPKLSSPDTHKVDTHDRPVGGIIMKLPRGTKPGTGTPATPPPAPGPIPPPLTTDLPPTETPPTPPPPIPPTIFGEPVQQSSFIFLMDVTGSMWGQKINSLKQALANDLQGLTPEVSFNIYAYSGRFGGETTQAEGWCATPENGCTSPVFSELSRPATPENIQAALAWLNSPPANPNGANPDWYSLNYVLNQRIPEDMQKFFYLSDGGVYGQHMINILNDVPAWWDKYKEKARFVGISYMADGSQQQFMQLLVASIGGFYIQR